MPFNIAILHYRHALNSAVFGMAEYIDMANEIASSKRSLTFASCHILDTENLPKTHTTKFDYVLIPPATSSHYDDSRLDRVRGMEHVSDWLLAQNLAGAKVAAACIGVYLPAQSGLLNGRHATTHWGVSDEMQQVFNDVQFDSNAILIDEGGVITAGGLMAWVDLMLCIVQRIYGQETMSVLSKQLLVDSGHRQQQFYKQFIPNKQHGDKAIEVAQQYIHDNFSDVISMKTLCEKAHLTERTLQRRFQCLFNLSPTEYIQRERVQYACQQLELSKTSIKQIALGAGYMEINGFRKIFQRVTGLTPSEYRKQFSPNHLSQYH